MGIYPPFASLTSSRKMLRPLLCGVAFAIPSMYFLFKHGARFPSGSYTDPSTSSILDHVLSPESIQAIHNSTLGFGDVYIINMPARTDKLDVLRLLTSVTNISFTVMPGVDGKTIPHVAWPGFYKEGKEASTGCWRAHMNAAASILENNLSSALIIEDDADWDVYLKTQLTQLALGSRHILNTPTSSRPLSPYGDGWDMLWLGHCAQYPPPQPMARFVIANDTTLPPAGDRWILGRPDKTLTYDLPNNETSRVVYRSAGGYCSYSYALSYAGAQKLLYHLSYSHFDAEIDHGLSFLCKDGTTGQIDFSCLAVYPGLIHTPLSGENDILHDPTKPRPERQKKKGMPGGANLVFGTRANVRNLMEGKEVVGRWPRDEQMGETQMWYDEGEGQ